MDDATYTQAPSSMHYTNAKVVIVGDSGVGKSSLGLVLTHGPFTPTESTHGRFIRSFSNQTVFIDKEQQEEREIFLWDLAGQPGYRLIHQLHLNEASLALVVFDGRSDTDPFSGVYHWANALQAAQRSNNAIPLKKFLIAARIDRGGIGVSHERIEALMQELDFDGYFETSAKVGWGIQELSDAIKAAIPWEFLPTIQSTVLVQRVMTFIFTQKEARKVCAVSVKMAHVCQ